MASATIRNATQDDAPVIAALGAQFFAEAGWSDVAEYDPASMTESLSAMIGSDQGIVLVADEGGEIAGMCAGVISPLYFNRARKGGEELFLWVRPDSRRGLGTVLLSALEDEARARGASVFGMKAVDASGMRPAVTERLWRMRGYRPCERSFIKRLEAA